MAARGIGTIRLLNSQLRQILNGKIKLNFFVRGLCDGTSPQSWQDDSSDDEVSQKVQDSGRQRDDDLDRYFQEKLGRRGGRDDRWSSYREPERFSDRGRYEQFPERGYTGKRYKHKRQTDNFEIKKDFYTEHPDVANMSQEKIDKFLKENHITFVGSDIPNPILNFNHGGFSADLQEQINRQNFSEPTPIQAVSWPLAMSGRDVVGIAQTGSGKTLGFVLPGLMHINSQPIIRTGFGPRFLVVVPTRELAQQVHSVVRRFARCLNLRCAMAFGGVGKGYQMELLKNDPQILIATPGRLNDFLEMGVTSVGKVTYLVLDEADRMLDMGFEPQIRDIVDATRQDRHTLMWSATWPKEIQALASEFLTSPVRINVGSTELMANHNIEQTFEVVGKYDKADAFMEYVSSKISGSKPKILVFTATKVMADQVAMNLRNRLQVRALAIHGDKGQRDRDMALNRFRSVPGSVLVATDVAARGIDVSDIDYVINFDAPKTIENYIHRIGRTARAGRHGTSFTILGADDGSLVKDLIPVLQEANQHVPQDLVKLQQYTNAQKAQKAANKRGGNRSGGMSSQSFGGRDGGFGGSRSFRNRDGDYFDIDDDFNDRLMHRRDGFSNRSTFRQSVSRNRQSRSHGFDDMEDLN